MREGRGRGRGRRGREVGRWLDYYLPGRHLILWIDYFQYDHVNTIGGDMIFVQLYFFL